jgi:predicted dehydrogenase
MLTGSRALASLLLILPVDPPASKESGLFVLALTAMFVRRRHFKMRNIRVGLIRCDTHGIWFGALMAEHDPKVLQRPMPPEEKPHYSWQTGGLYNFFYANYGHPLEISAPYVGGFEIVSLWDEHRDAAEMAARVFHGRPRVCERFEDVSDGVDLVLVADCNYDGSDHLKLARPGLEKGVATFVDKPFADTVSHAREILEFARRHRAPVFSLSILRAEPALKRFRSRIPETGEVNFATLQGYGTQPAGLVATISAVQHLFGTEIQTVQVLRAARHTSVYLDYGDRPDRPKHGVMINCDIGQRPFTALAISIYGTKDDIHLVMHGDFVYQHGTAEIIKMMKQIVRTGDVPPLMDEVIESIAVIQAFQEAEKTGSVVKVQKFL